MATLPPAFTIAFDLTDEHISDLFFALWSFAKGDRWRDEQSSLMRPIRHAVQTQIGIDIATLTDLYEKEYRLIQTDRNDQNQWVLRFERP
jgi:hypothetical protein